MKRKRFVGVILLLALLLQLCGCARKVEEPVATFASTHLGTVDLMADHTPQTVELQNISDESRVLAASFAVRLLQNAYDGETCVLSPYSVYLALAMTANGAEGQTLAQMESVLGLPCDRLNDYAYALLTEAGDEVKSADSVWYRHMDGFTVNSDFLQTNADYYGASAYVADFDEQTMADINAWVSEHTGGRIEKMLDEIPDQTMLYLLQTLCFDAEWKYRYYDNNLHDGVFHGVNGDENVTMMTSSENQYLDDGMATGFVKDYLGGRYCFAALLPNEGVDLDDYLASLTGEGLIDLISSPEGHAVDVCLPKFTAKTETELSATLCKMGMPLAFSLDADFSRMSNLDLMISSVNHSTYLCVDDAGTKAAAATSVEMTYKMSIISYSVVLDRPFVMAIFDRQTQTFLFLGVIGDISE